MPFNEALFWFGIAALGVGPFFIFDGGMKKVYGIALTVAGVLACAYSVYRYHHPEALPQIPFWIIIWVLTWVLLGYDVYFRRFRRLPSLGENTGKLIIRNAGYGPVDGGGHEYDVAEFLRKIITGDSLVFDIDNHNFVVDGENFVPSDPKPFATKRLRVEYSYDGVLGGTIVRYEHDRLVLPEDSTIKWLMGEVERLKNAQAMTHSAVDTLKQSEILRSLPVYFHDLEVKLLVADVGTTLDLSDTTLFLKLSFTSDDDTGLRDMEVTVSVSERKYTGAPLDDLSDWILQAPFKNPQFPYKTVEEKSLDTVSLWRDIRHNGLKAGLVKTGWVGIKIPDARIAIKEAQRVKIEVMKPQPKRAYRFYFSDFPETYERVFDADLRRPH